MGTNIKKELLRFISEDVQGGDITSVLLPKNKINAKIISRQAGVLAGIKFARDIFHLKGCNVKIIKKDAPTLISAPGPSPSVVSQQNNIEQNTTRTDRGSGAARPTSVFVL